MKKFSLLLGLIAFISFNLLAFEEKVLCNFDDVKPAAVEGVRGGVFEEIENPFSDDDNNTTNSGQYYGEDYDNGTTVARVWTANVAIPIEEMTIPTSGAYYVHVLVNCYTKPDIAVTFENIQAKSANRPLTAYDVDQADYWQDMVFKLPAQYLGMTVDTLNFFGDMKWESGNAFVTDMFTHVYFDEIIINDNPLSRFSDVVIPESLTQTISTLEDGELTWASRFGAIASVEDNPDMAGINTTSKCLKLGDAKETFYALVDYITPDLMLPKKDCYLHIMAKSTTSPLLSVRMMPENGVDYFAKDSLVPNDEWQDLVFDISEKATAGTMVDSIRFILDFRGSNLNTSDSVLYIDEVVFTTDSMPRGGASAINAVQRTSISVYPTLVDNQLTVVGGSLLMLDVINLSGTRVYTKAVVDNVIELSDLESGIYLVRGRDALGNVLLTEKIVKK